MRKRHSDLLLRFNSINLKFQELYDQYSKFFDEANKKMLEYKIKINDSFLVYAFKETESELSKETLDLLGDNLDYMRSIEKYSIYNTLAVLRIMTRKANKLTDQNWQFKKRIKSLLKEVKKLEEDISNRVWSEEEYEFFNDFYYLKESLLSWEKLEFVELRIPFEYVLNLFVEGRTLKKQEFLQVITFSKNKKRWDGTPTTPYAVVIKDIPEEIDFETLKRLIFLEKIEDDRDCYLFDIFMEEALKNLEQIRKETGRSPALEFLSEVSGKPIQTYTAEIDEYGDVVSLEPNKPNLRAIEGGRKND